MTKLLHIYMTFTIDRLDFSLMFFQNIVIFKNNSMRTALNPSFDAQIVIAKHQIAKAFGILKVENIIRE